MTSSQPAQPGQFDASAHPRATDGKFAVKQHAEADPFDVLPDRDLVPSDFDGMPDPTCFECGADVAPDPDGSPGVYVHLDDDGERDYDADEEHAPVPSPFDDDMDDMEPDDYSAETDPTESIMSFQIPGSSSDFEVRRDVEGVAEGEVAETEFEVWRDGSFVGTFHHHGPHPIDPVVLRNDAVRALDPAAAAQSRLVDSISNDQWRTEAAAFRSRYAPAPTGEGDYYPDWRRAHTESARDLQIGQRLASGRLITHLDATSSPGTVFVYTDGRIGPGRWDGRFNHGDPVKVHDDRVDLSDPDWFENEAQRCLAEKITEDAIVTGRPSTDEQVAAWDRAIRDGLYRAYATTDISPLSPTGDPRTANGRAKIGDDVTFESPMHGQSAYRVIGKKAVRHIVEADENGVRWEDSAEVDYVLQDIATGNQSTANLRGHGWKRIPAPGDNGPGARAARLT